jgi:hypothetical protein
MDGTTLLLGFLFGTIGTGYFLFGKSQGRMIPLGAGIALMAVPMFITNVIACTVVCVAMMAVPWFVRDG